MREVFDAHAPFLHRTVVGLGVRAADAEDLCQEIFLIVHRRMGDFTGGSLRAWLYGIATRVVSDHRRRAHVRREIPTETIQEGSIEPSQADHLDQRRAEQRLLSVLDELDEDKRAAFVLYEIEELTIKEIAQVIGCPLQTAYSRLQGARQHVRNAFASTPSKVNVPSKPPRSSRPSQPPIPGPAAAIGRSTS
jgi:RNA polymerase sigma-70 factor (ECF subfamily)